MKRVEFFGVPGVGKSTVCRAIKDDAQRRTPSGLLFYSDLKKHTHDSALTRYLTVSSGDMTQTADDGRSLSARTKAFRRDALRKRGPHWDDFLDVALDSYRGANENKPNKLARLAWTIATLENCIVVDQIPTDGYMIFDGGLCQAGMSLALCLSIAELDAVLEQYFTLLPNPSAVIILSASATVIRDRMLERAARSSRGDRTRHIPATMQALECASRILGQQNVPVLTLDATENVADNVARVHSFLSKIDDAPTPVPSAQAHAGSSHPVDADGKHNGPAQLGGLDETRGSYHNTKASSYDKKREGAEKWKVEQKLFHDLLSQCDAGTTILDVPVGTGRFIPMYESLGLSATGVDLSEDMLDLAAEKRSHGDTKTRLLQGDILAGLPFSGKAFDVGVCVRLMNWMNDEELKRSIAELAGHCREKIALTVRYAKDPSYSGRSSTGGYIHRKDVLMGAMNEAGLLVESEYVIQTSKRSTYSLFVAAVPSQRPMSLDGRTG